MLTIEEKLEVYRRLKCEATMTQLLNELGVVSQRYVISDGMPTNWHLLLQK